MGKGTGTALAKPEPRNEIEAVLTKRVPDIVQLGLSAKQAERLTKQAVLACAREPKLLRCDRATVAMSVYQAAELGLDLALGQGQAYLVPYGGACQLIIGYRGMVDIACRGGHIASIEARIVRPQDEFALEYGTEPRIRHTPRSPKPNQPQDDIVGAYAIATRADGGRQFVFLWRDEINRVRQKGGPWATNYAEMAMKTAVRRLWKLLPLSAMGEAAKRAAEIDGEAEVIEMQYAEQRETARVAELDEVVPPLDEQGGADDGPPLVTTADIDDAFGR